MQDALVTSTYQSPCSLRRAAAVESAGVRPSGEHGRSRDGLGFKSRAAGPRPHAPGAAEQPQQCHPRRRGRGALSRGGACRPAWPLHPLRALFFAGSRLP